MHTFSLWWWIFGTYLLGMLVFWVWALFLCLKERQMPGWRGLLNLLLITPLWPIVVIRNELLPAVHRLVSYMRFSRSGFRARARDNVERKKGNAEVMTALSFANEHQQETLVEMPLDNGAIDESDHQTSTGANRAFPSRVFPDFSLHPLNPNPSGSRLEGEYLGSIGAVGLAICNEFQSGKTKMRNGWPDYADGELAALERTYRKMLRKGGAQHNVDVILVRKLAREYVERLISSRDAHSKFMNAEWTIWHMSIDFANTIGYGGAIDSALDWAKNSNWLG